MMVGVSQLSRIIAYRNCPFDHDLSKGNEWINEIIYPPTPPHSVTYTTDQYEDIIDHRSSTHNLFVKLNPEKNSGLNAVQIDI